MIIANSRYIDGLIIPQDDETVTVRRRFPRVRRRNFLYTWKQSDRLDLLAARHLGSSTAWWKIMDANPMIQNPGDIRPGQQIRIPRRV